MTTTITSSREIDRVFGSGKRIAHPLLVALVIETPDGRGPQGRVAFIAGKKTGNAVRRNRSKRVLRASVHRVRADWAGYDVALIARGGTAHASTQELDAALRGILARAGISHG